MGEIADMMLDGTLCEGCGEFIGEGDGFPQYCSSSCASDRGADEAQVKKQMTDQKYKTRAMVEDALKAHHRKLFWVDAAYYCGLALLAAIVFLSVIAAIL